MEPKGKAFRIGNHSKHLGVAEMANSLLTMQCYAVQVVTYIDLLCTISIKLIILFLS